MWIAMGGYKSASSIDFLINAHRVAMDSAAQRGLPSSSSKVLSHIIVRNEAGKRLRLEVDESKRRLFDDLAALLLQDVSWSKLENKLYSEYGHVNPDTGKPYGARTMYTAVYNPYFWGNSGRHSPSKYSALCDSQVS
jgi:hypothetical protein